MPMHFGRKAHFLHGVPMRPERSGKAMQRDLDARRDRGGDSRGPRTCGGRPETAP